jgi:antitoxin VapB
VSKSPEFENKLRRVRNLLDEKGLDALLLQNVSSFYWATCGVRADVNLASSIGVARLLITRDNHYLITNNLEATRYDQDDRIVNQGWELIISPWYAEQDMLQHLTKGLLIGADGIYPGAQDLAREMVLSRSSLTVEEQNRMRSLGKLCARVIESVAQESQPGMSEIELSARMVYHAALQELQAITHIVASDERITAYRHPLSTRKPVDRLMMLVLCGRKDGLVCSITRLIHFGKMNPELSNANQKAAWISAVAFHNTRPGLNWRTAFEALQLAYVEVGCENEWTVHHQGGLVGYEPREVFIRPGFSYPIMVGQAAVWNPSIGSARSMDTFLVCDNGIELVTSSISWPKLQVEVKGIVYQRPTILEIL